MRTPCLTHTLERDRDEIRIVAATEDLALVDAETYPVFLDAKADYFDLMAHLSAQREALTAMAWKAPAGALNLRVQITGGDHVLEQSRAGRVMIASCSLRCHGQLVLTTHERLFDCAKHRNHALLRGGRLPKEDRSQIINVPAGIYSIFIYYQADSSFRILHGDGSDVIPCGAYNVLLRHHPFPPRRVAPVRLHSKFLASQDEAASVDQTGVITSHARIW